MKVHGNNFVFDNKVVVKDISDYNTFITIDEHIVITKCRNMFHIVKDDGNRPIPIDFKLCKDYLRDTINIHHGYGRLLNKTDYLIILSNIGSNMYVLHKVNINTGMVEYTDQFKDDIEEPEVIYNKHIIRNNIYWSYSTTKKDGIKEYNNSYTNLISNQSYTYMNKWIFGSKPEDDIIFVNVEIPINNIFKQTAGELYKKLNNFGLVIYSKCPFNEITKCSNDFVEQVSLADENTLFITVAYPDNNRKCFKIAKYTDGRGVVVEESLDFHEVNETPQEAMPEPEIPEIQAEMPEEQHEKSKNKLFGRKNKNNCEEDFVKLFKNTGRTLEQVIYILQNDYSTKEITKAAYSVMKDWAWRE